jgi:hypothetical protein
VTAQSAPALCPHLAQGGDVEPGFCTPVHCLSRAIRDGEPEARAAAPREPGPHASTAHRPRLSHGLETDWP